MSTLKTNRIQHLTSGFNNVVQFVDGAGTQNGTLCRAWVNFNGTGTVAIRAQFNVSSITDNGVGDYTVNLSNAMLDANYALTGSASRTISGNNTISMSIEFNSNMTSSSFRIMTGMDNYNFTDSDTVCPAIFR
jgi:hypothetical protein